MRLMFLGALLAGLTVWGADQAFSSTANLPKTVERVNSPGIHNMFRLGTNVYSGGSPEGEEAFAGLAKLGIKTIVTVDGTKPDVEKARKYGIRYVHLPHGYDGIDARTQGMLVKAAESAGGPIFVHCHHGMHRGPAAAAVVCMSEFGWTKEEAEAWLVAAGTASNYVGLYDVVRNFNRPSAEVLKALPAELPEIAKVSGLTEGMVDVDRRWDHLKAVKAAGYATPKDHPDLKPANEALILWEHYREMQRLPESEGKGTDFLARLKTAENEAKEAERLLREFAKASRPDIRGKLDRSFEAVGRSCAACHKDYRDPAGIKSGK